MKLRNILLISASFLIIASASCDKRENIKKNLPNKSSKKIKKFLTGEEYLKLPEEKIDIAEGALIIAKGLYPKIDISNYLKQIDTMAKELKILLNNVKEPQRIIKTINLYLFEKQRFKFTKEGYGLLNDVLNKKIGNCAGFSTLYLSITQRLNMPCYGVRVPKHMFIRYDDGMTKINTETTFKGKIFTDKEIIKHLHISLTSINNGVYLRNLSKKEVLAELINNRATIVYDNKGDLNKTLQDFNKAISLNPKLAEAYHGRGRVYYDKANYAKAMQDFNKTICLNPKAAEPYCGRAAIYALNKKKENMLTDLKKAIELNPKCKNWAKTDGAFKDYREDKEFKKLVE